MKTLKRRELRKQRFEILDNRLSPFSLFAPVPYFLKSRNPPSSSATSTTAATTMNSPMSQRRDVQKWSVKLVLSKPHLITVNVLPIWSACRRRSSRRAVHFFAMCCRGVRPSSGVGSHAVWHSSREQQSTLTERLGRGLRAACNHRQLARRLN